MDQDMSNDLVLLSKFSFSPFCYCSCYFCDGIAQYISLTYEDILVINIKYHIDVFSVCSLPVFELCIDLLTPHHQQKNKYFAAFLIP